MKDDWVLLVGVGAGLWLLKHMSTQQQPQSPPLASGMFNPLRQANENLPTPQVGPPAQPVVLTAARVEDLPAQVPNLTRAEVAGRPYYFYNGTWYVDQPRGLS